jgi:multidrug resistance efflux pump
MKTAWWMCLLAAFPWAANLGILADEQPARQESVDSKIVLQKKGYVVPAHSVLISPEVSGRVTALHFEEGKKVKRGELLAELEATPYAIEERRAAALAEAAAARLKDCIGRNGAVLVAKAELTAAELAREAAKHRLSATKVYAPCDGIVISKETEEGCMVDRNSFNGSYAVCKLVNLAQMDVEVWVEETEIHRIFRGQPCSIVTEAFPSAPYKGVVTRIGPLADRAKNCIDVRVRIQVPKDDDKLMPEMAAVVSFLAKQ